MTDWSDGATALALVVLGALCWWGGFLLGKWMFGRSDD